MANRLRTFHTIRLTVSHPPPHAIGDHHRSGGGQITTRPLRGEIHEIHEIGTLVTLLVATRILGMGEVQKEVMHLLSILHSMIGDPFLTSVNPKLDHDMMQEQVTHLHLMSLREGMHLRTVVHLLLLLLLDLQLPEPHPLWRELLYSLQCHMSLLDHLLPPAL